MLRRSSRFTCALLVALSLAASLFAPSLLAAQSLDVRHNLEPDEFVQAVVEHTAGGNRLVSVNGFGISNQVRFAATWELGSSVQTQTRHHLTRDKFISARRQIENATTRLASISVYRLGNELRYAAIWDDHDTRPSDSHPITPYDVRIDLTPDAYRNALRYYNREGYDLVYVNGAGLGTKVRYAAIWEEQPTAKADRRKRIARHGETGLGMTGQEHDNALHELAAQQYRLMHVSSFAVNDKPRYAAIWKRIKPGDPNPRYQARYRLGAREYHQQHQKQTAAGYHLTCLTACGIRSQPLYAAIWQEP